MSDRTVNVAVIGCGKMGINHIKTITALPGSELVAVVDPRLDADTPPPAVPATLPVFTSSAEMYRAVKPDIVHIVTPPQSHADLAAEALEAGAHVYVEKPFTLAGAEAERVLGIARRQGLSVCAGHQLLFHPNYHKALQTLPTIGKVVHLESYFAFRPVRRISPVDQLIDILPHPTYTLLGAMDAADPESSPEPVEVRAVEATADGEVRALLRRGDCLATLVISLQGRPVDSYLKVVGVHGSVHADFILSGVTRHFGSGATAVAVILRPFSEALQRLGRSTGSLWRLIRGKEGGYSGLPQLIEAFHRSVQDGKPSPVSPNSIIQATTVCAAIIAEARSRSELRENQCADKTTAQEKRLPKASRGCILVTGAAGFLGKVTCERLRNEGWDVLGVTRRQLVACDRVAGVRYLNADLANGLPEGTLEGVQAIVHLAAETAGGQTDHERNTINATKRLIEQADTAGVQRFVNISSVAVMKPSATQRGAALTETSPVDRGNLARGPYVWAKAEAEALVEDATAGGRIDGRTIRLGPLIDYRNFHPPGRLGREVGPWFVGVGKKNGPLSVCDVSTAADVIAYYLNAYESAPALLNLLDPEIPTRRELADRFLAARPDLKRIWIPDWMLRALSTVLKAVLRIRRPSAEPLDVYAAFSAEPYDVTLAGEVVRQARLKVCKAATNRNEKLETA